MKLLLCRKCHDIFRLTKGKVRDCFCGESEGIYVDDRNVEISGPSTVIGFSNKNFWANHIVHLLGEQDSMVQIESTKFEAFFIADTAESIKRIDK